MSQKIESFNVEPLMIEIEGVITMGVKTILKDFMNRYELLEKTHTKIMDLPSVRNELNKSPYNESDGNIHTEKLLSDKPNTLDESDKLMETIIKDTTRNYVREEICEIEKKLDKILTKIHLLDQQVKTLTQTQTQTQCDNNFTDKIVIKPSIVSACENENIQVEIKENEDEMGKKHENIKDIIPMTKKMGSFTNLRKRMK